MDDIAQSTAAPARSGEDLTAAKRVLELEADALRTLAGALDGNFSRAVEIMAAVKGRVIVSGMGKSGHVGRKIAATLASTGTPAQFVHPAEASHGDLGMITRDDAVLALSNSGETAELSDLLAYVKRRGIKLVCITGDSGSTLGEQADVTLALPKLTEACPHGLAPTTSTTATLALGDALAVALLGRKEFSAADFQILHPGGKLGRRLLRVADLMHKGDALPLVPGVLPMSETLLTMTAKHFGCVGVIDDAGNLVGVVTDGDLRRNRAPDLLKRRTEDVMTKRPRSIRPQALAAEALGVMNNSAITSLFAVEGGKPVGIVHIHDCLRAGIT